MKLILVAIHGLAIFSTTVFGLPDDPQKPKVDLEQQHPIVAGFERFVEDDRFNDTERGMLLLNELNCASCHQHEAAFWASEKRVAPILSEIGNRVQPEYFEKFILNPHQTKPGTTMPDVLAGKSETVRKEAANTIAHFLASTGHTAHQPTLPKEIKQGKELFHTLGCVACHDPQESDDQISTSIPLGNLAEKYTVSGLSSFLADPLHSRPSGRMPQLNLSGDQIRSIAAYLLRDVKVDAAINFRLYEGAWDKLPDFDSLEVKQSGTMPIIDVKGFTQADNYGLVFTGYWEVLKPLDVKFRLGSDDGSRLIINGEMVLEVDGVHPVKFVEVTKQLPAGTHEVRLEYFEKGGGEALECTIEAKEFGKQSLGTVLRKDKEPPKPAADAFVFNAEKAKKGAAYFQSLGCANCHDMEMDGNQFVSTMENPKPLSDLTSGKGCISNSIASPVFHFNEAQQNALNQALKSLADSSPTAELNANQRVHQQFTSFNCYGCHSRETGNRGDDDFMLVGGVVDKTGGDSFEVYGRDKWFKGTEAEMGDEGRHPPDLKLVGAKLQRQWLEHLFDQSSNDRTYMTTLMPRFGKTNMEGLVDDLIEADPLPRRVEVTQTESMKKVKGHGRHLAGESGLSCIKCHTFGTYASSGVPAISLTTMTKRLNKDWFQVYMLKPSDFRRGTRMPESWPDGKTFYPDMLGGDTNLQINALWEYLTDGDKAAKPKGLVKGKMEVLARDEPVVYRNFIEGAGPRAIGVGYPELVNLAFDADNCRMAMLWQENFIDGSRHWTGRGQGFEPPLGDNVLRLPESLAFYDGIVEEWPTSTDKESAREQGMKFLGYSFNEKRQPTFMYQYNNVKITDQPLPFSIEGVGMMRRKFTLEGDQKLLYRAYSAAKIESVDNGFVVDDNLKIAFDGDIETEVVSANGKQHLIVSIDPSQGPVTFEQTYNW